MAELLEDELMRLREEWMPIQAIAAIRRELDIPLAEAKAYLRAHPAWRDALAEWDETLDEALRSDNPEVLDAS